MPTAEELIKLSNESADSGDRLAEMFVPNVQSRGYIGTPTARLGSVRSIDGQGFPLVLKWTDEGGFTTCRYVWPVKK